MEDAPRKPSLFVFGCLPRHVAPHRGKDDRYAQDSLLLLLAPTHHHGVDEAPQRERERGAAIAEAVPKHNSPTRSGPGGHGGSLPDRRRTALNTKKILFQSHERGPPDEVTWTTKSWLGLQKQRISHSLVLHTASIAAEQIVNELACGEGGRWSQFQKEKSSRGKPQFFLAPVVYLC